MSTFSSRSPSAAQAQSARPSLWRNRVYIVNVIGFTISVTGDGFHSVALSLWILQTTRSATAMALVTAAQVAVAVLLGAVAGTICDRMNRRRLLIITDLLRAGLVLTIAALIAQDARSLAALVALKAAIAACTTFYNTAFAASLVNIVGKEEVTRGGSVIQLARTAALIAGPALGGLYVAVAGTAMAMNVDAASFLISAAAIFLAGHFPSPIISGDERESFWSTMRNGFQYIRQQPFILSLAVLLPTFNFFANSAILLVPVIAITVWNTSQVQYGLLQGLFTMGIAAGALFLMLYATRLRRRGYWMLGGWLAMGALGALIMGMPSLLPALPFIFLVGIMISLVNILLTSALQNEVPPDVQGRVMGTLNSLNDLATPVAIMIAGVIADAWGPALVGVALCLACVLISGASLVLFPAIRRYQ